jgi:hypothetical protein
LDNLVERGASPCFRLAVIRADGFAASRSGLIDFHGLDRQLRAGRFNGFGPWILIQEFNIPARMSAKGRGRVKTP